MDKYADHQSSMLGRQSRIFFQVCRPDLAKSMEEKQHRQLLTNFILSQRKEVDLEIKELLHKELAYICDRHFKPDDIRQNGDAMELRIGAVPCVIPLSDHNKKTVSRCGSTTKKKSNFSGKIADGVDKSLKSMKVHKVSKKRKNAPKLKCFHCGYTTHYTVHMNNHIVNFHLRVKTYECAKCPKTAISKKLIKKHENTAHKNVEKIKPSEYRVCKCGYRSISFSRFRRHFRFNHMPNFPWTCSLCSFVSEKEDQLKMHVAHNHPQSHEFICGLCGFKASKREYIKLHVIKKHFYLLNHQEKQHFESTK